MSENHRSEVGGLGLGMSLHTQLVRDQQKCMRGNWKRNLEENQLNMKSSRPCIGTKKKKSWVDRRSEDVVTQVETRVAEDSTLSNESDVDASQRQKKIDDYYVESAGLKKQKTYGLGNYDSSTSSTLSQADIDHAREEGRAEGRAEMQQKVDECLSHQKETEEHVRILMQHVGLSRNMTPQNQTSDNENLDED